MGKPLLTDEIIARANRGEKFYDDEPLRDSEETKVIKTERPRPSAKEPNLISKIKNRKNDDGMVYKSRRIENAKRKEFQKKLNLILLIVIVLIVILVYAVFNL